MSFPERRSLYTFDHGHKPNLTRLHRHTRTIQHLLTYLTVIGSSQWFKKYQISCWRQTISHSTRSKYAFHWLTVQARTLRHCRLIYKASYEERKAYSQIVLLYALGMSWVCKIAQWFVRFGRTRRSAHGDCCVSAAPPPHQPWVVFSVGVTEFGIIVQTDGLLTTQPYLNYTPNCC